MQLGFPDSSMSNGSCHSLVVIISLNGREGLLGSKLDMGDVTNVGAATWILKLY